MLTLRGFQEDAVAETVDIVHEVLTRQRQAAVAVLASPTASGKTVMLAAVLRKTAAETKLAGTRAVWFWLAPFKGLIGQAQETLRCEAGVLRIRNLADDRRVETTEDGDVWVSTWQAVAAKDEVARRIRDGNEDNPSIFTLVERLRAAPKPFRIGLVIDEAHLSISGENQSFEFVRRIGPDIVLMATATPDFDRADSVARLLKCDRLTMGVSRADVVAEGLNKRNALVAVVSPDSVRAIGAQVHDVAIRHALDRNRIILEELRALDLDIEPLLLVQVENGKEAVESARALLRSAGLADGEIAVHTADEPDPDLLRMAADPGKKALIFKTAVATGFDAPRAWVMAALRRVRDKDFGIQILGRLMRVHPLLQGMAANGSLPAPLDTAYLVMTQLEAQGGLEQAAESLNGMQTFATVIVPEFTLTPGPVSGKAPGTAPARGSAPPAGGSADGSVGGSAGDGGQPELWRPPGIRPPAFVYGLRAGLDGMPHDFRLLTERGRDGGTMDPADVARHLTGLTRETFFGWINDETVTASVDETSLLGEAAASVTKVSAKRDRNEVIRIGQAALRGIPDRAPMLRAIEARVAKIYGEADGDDIRFGVWALLAYEPAKFREAVKLAKAGTIEAVPSAEPLPAAIHSEIALKAAAGNIYGVMPPGMLTWETDFAKWLEAAEPVIWWHRNETGKPWSLAVMREDGHPFYPDFVVRVRGRKTPGLRLLDPHERFEDSVGKKKSRVRHVAYGKTMLLYKLPADKQFHLIELRNDQQPYVGAPLEASMLLVED